MNFADLGLSDGVIRAVVDAGYETPTPIQEKAIPTILMGRDVLGAAQTGTGKTAGFTLPMIDILAEGRAKARMPRSLIIEPTRELAAQVAESFDKYGKYHKLTKALLVGGESFTEQEKKLDRGVDVLIATPGRLIDLFERGKILLGDVKILVIDEADRMLDMGFIPDVERIVSMLPAIRQTLFFSATMPPEIRKLADKFLLNPKEISVSRPATTAETVKDFLVVVGPRDKRKAMTALLKSENPEHALIFCNRKRDVDALNRALKGEGFAVEALHGDMAQSVRTETLGKFKQREIPILVASDVAARGLDISGMSHVFNYDVPHNADDYVHRIGRTGRAGREGRAFTLAVPDDAKSVTAIEKLVGRQITRAEGEGYGGRELEETAEGEAPRGRRGRGKPRTEKKAAEAKGGDKPAEKADNEGRKGRKTDKAARGDKDKGAHSKDEKVEAETSKSSDRRKSDKSSRSNGRRSRRDEERELKPEPVPTGNPVGMGDHIPDFLKRPARQRNG